MNPTNVFDTQLAPFTPFVNGNVGIDSFPFPNVGPPGGELFNISRSISFASGPDFFLACDITPGMASKAFPSGETEDYGTNWFIPSIYLTFSLKSQPVLSVPIAIVGGTNPQTPSTLWTFGTLPNSNFQPGAPLGPQASAMLLFAQGLGATSSTNVQQFGDSNPRVAFTYQSWNGAVAGSNFNSLRPTTKISMVCDTVTLNATVWMDFGVGSPRGVNIGAGLAALAL